jgi:hypothetical protein
MTMMMTMAEMTMETTIISTRMVVKDEFNKCNVV